jgi:hypothetical protein
MPLGDSMGDKVIGVLGMTVVHAVAPQQPVGMDYAKDFYVPVDGLP